MNALTQYLDLYASGRSLLDGSGTPGLFSSLRPAALEALRGARLPQKGDEGYEKTSLEDIYAPDYGLNLARVEIPVDVAASFRCDVPGVSTLLGFIVNDRFVPSRRLADGLPEGVTFCSLRSAAAQWPDLVAETLGKIAPESDPLVALNNLLLTDGVFIRIAPGVKIEKPLQLVNIFASPTPLMAVRRIVVSLGEGAAARLLVCDHTQDSERRYLSSQVVEISLAPEASFEMVDVEESSLLTSRCSRLYARQEARSSLTLNSTTLTCGVTRNDFRVSVDGERCETRLAGMVIGDRTMHTDNCSDVSHNAPHCHSDQLFKYVLSDTATAAFEGSILVTPAAPFTEAYQSNRNLLASEGARMHSKPQLEIYNDEVKCSHGATIGQLDNDALFYMRTRGIPEHEARRMLMQAFMTDVIDTIRIPGLHDRMLMLVDRRFSGCPSCDTCAGLK